MSKEKKLVDALVGYAIHSSGANLSRRARTDCLRRFGRIVVGTGGFQIERPEQIGLRHIRFYIEHRRGEKASAGTLKNEMSHLRRLLRAIGKSSLAEDPAMSNGALGIGKRDRAGSKVPFSDFDLTSVLVRVAESSGPGLFALCLVSLALGLRIEESVIAHAWQLKMWRRELTERGEATVWQGTKGGRTRNVIPFNLRFALSVLDYAIGQVGVHGYLVKTAKGKPTVSLKQSMCVVKNFFSRARIQHHRFRYTYANKLALVLRDRGFEWSAVWRLVATYLGHGDGRGRWVKQVYARELSGLIDSTMKEYGSS